MDSLQAIWLRQELKRAFPSVSTTMEMIYTNPTIRSLASSIVQASSGNIGEDRQADELNQMLQRYLSAIDALLDDEIAMPDIATCDLSEEMVGCTEYTASPTSRSSQHKPNTSAKGALLLTGSTGALGSHILNTLLDREQCQIYCLNRSVDSCRLQIGRNKIGGLPVVFPEGRVQFLTGNPALPNFGLDGQTYEDLLGSVTHVIHNAWPVGGCDQNLGFGYSRVSRTDIVAFIHNRPDPLNECQPVCLERHLSVHRLYQKCRFLALMADDQCSTNLGVPGNSLFKSHRIGLLPVEKDDDIVGSPVMDVSVEQSWMLLEKIFGSVFLQIVEVAKHRLVFLIPSDLHHLEIFAILGAKLHIGFWVDMDVIPVLGTIHTFFQQQWKCCAFAAAA